LKSSNSFDRIRGIVSKRYLDKGFAEQLIEALNTISGIRLQLHVHYGREEDTFATDDADKTTPEQYVLSEQEKSALVKAGKVLNIFHYHPTLT
jgi:signal-transduction protein with cAMP-binding, CBS, and nucleotidyltransferase domain